jgi:hypothetical protein
MQHADPRGNSFVAASAPNVSQWSKRSPRRGYSFSAQNLCQRTDIRHREGYSLIADWIAYKNNTYSIMCIETELDCSVASVAQIGWKQIGTIDGPIIYPIKRWTKDHEVIAEADYSPCSRITITLDRTTETVLWVETPINQTTIACLNADTAVRKATLEASPRWRNP